MHRLTDMEIMEVGELCELLNEVRLNEDDKRVCEEDKHAFSVNQVQKSW